MDADIYVYKAEVRGLNANLKKMTQEWMQLKRKTLK